MKILIFFLAILGSSFAYHQIVLYSNCPFPIWPAILGNPGKSIPMNGGFQLNTWSAVVFNVEYGWAGRIWPRRDCDGSGRCVSGDCGNRIQCRGAGGVPPATLAEFTLDGWGGIDYYDVSLVDGYNLPVRITPTAGTYRKTSYGPYDCTPAGCFADLNPSCPNELAVWHYGWKVACKSACLHFNTDQYCCRGAHNQPHTCNPNHWPVNYAAIFKRPCPGAYSYAYDDVASTFTCKGNPISGYTVTFCP